MEKLTATAFTMVLVPVVLGLTACPVEPPAPAHLSFDNETGQRIEVEVVSEIDRGEYAVSHRLAPDEDPDKEPRTESGEGADSTTFRWHRDSGGPDEINRYMKKVIIRTEQGCVINVTPDQLEEWSDGPDYRFFVELTPKRVSCSKASKEE